MGSDLIIVQARLSSSRLPGKVLKPLFGQLSVLDLQLQSLKRQEIPIVLATTTNPVDDALEKWCESNELPCFRGNELNVLKRFVDCARSHEAENLIRICSDNPFLQTGQIPWHLESLKNGADYSSFKDPEGVPAIRKHWGLFPEGIKRSALEKAQVMLDQVEEHKFYEEHVTNFIYGNADKFEVDLRDAPEEIFNRDDLRFTIDTLEDFENLKALSKSIGFNHEISLKELTSTVDSMPNVKEVMMHGIAQFSK